MCLSSVVVVVSLGGDATVLPWLSVNAPLTPVSTHVLSYDVRRLTNPSFKSCGVIVRRKSDKEIYVLYISSGISRDSNLL